MSFVFFKDTRSWESCNSTILVRKLHSMSQDISEMGLIQSHTIRTYLYFLQKMHMSANKLVAESTIFSKFTYLFWFCDAKVLFKIPSTKKLSRNQELID